MKTKKYSNYLEEVIQERLEESSNFERGAKFSDQLKHLEQELEAALKESEKADKEASHYRKNPDLGDDERIAAKKATEKVLSLRKQIQAVKDQQENVQAIHDARMER